MVIVGTPILSRTVIEEFGLVDCNCVAGSLVHQECQNGLCSGYTHRQGLGTSHLDEKIVIH